MLKVDHSDQIMSSLLNSNPSVKHFIWDNNLIRLNYEILDAIFNELPGHVLQENVLWIVDWALAQQFNRLNLVAVLESSPKNYQNNPETLAVLIVGVVRCKVKVEQIAIKGCPLAAQICRAFETFRMISSSNQVLLPVLVVEVTKKILEALKFD